jgi:hypothetical protein
MQSRLRLVNTGMAAQELPKKVRQWYNNLVLYCVTSTPRQVFVLTGTNVEQRYKSGFCVQTLLLIDTTAWEGATIL